MYKTKNTSVRYCTPGFGAIHIERRTWCRLFFHGFHSKRVLIAWLASHAPGIQPLGRLQSALQMGRRSTGAGIPEHYVRAVDASIRRAQ